jgi:hypothetical protein
MFISLPLFNGLVEPSTYSTILTYWPNGKMANTLQQIKTWPRSLMLGTGINRVFVGIRALLIGVMSNSHHFKPDWVCHRVTLVSLCAFLLDVTTSLLQL